MFRVTTGFATWLRQEMQRRGWSVSELAHKAGTYPATISNLLNENRKPGKAICKQLAKALDLKESIVLYHAGFLSKDPEDPTQQLDPLALDILAMLSGKTENEKRAALAALKALFENLDRVKEKGK